MQLKSLLQEWLSSNLVLMCKIRTYVRYRDIVEKHLIPDLGESEADSLTSRTIGEYLASKRKHGNLKTGETLSASTVNMIRTVLKLALQYACEHEYIRENPVLTTQRMRNKSVRVTAFTLQEQRLIEKAVCKSEDNRLIGVKISLYTGLRIGELLALRWGDIDFRSGMLYVSKTVYQAKNEENIWVTVIDRPKSDASVRYVPMFRYLPCCLKN